MTRPTPAGLRWRAAADDLSPEKSLSRVAANAKYVVATVTVVGATLATVGVTSAAGLADRPAIRALVLVAAVLSALAVVVALSFLTLRSHPVNLENLVEVESWYAAELKRGIWVRVAGYLLVIAVLTAITAGILAAVSASPRARLGIQAVPAGTTTKVTASATFEGLRSAATVHLYADQVLLGVASRQPDAGGAVTIEMAVDAPATGTAYRIVAEADGLSRTAYVSLPTAP